MQSRGTFPDHPAQTLFDLLNLRDFALSRPIRTGQKALSLNRGAFARQRLPLCLVRKQGGKGYISQSLFEELFVDDIHLITRIRKNMKNSLMHLRDKILQRKRSLIETVNDEVKHIVQIEHTRRRSVGGFAANLMVAMAA